MGKSIRSKSRKASRSEFRNTIGASAADDFMKKTNAKMQEILKQGNGIESLSSVFGTGPAAPVDNGDEDDMIDAPAQKSKVSDIKVQKKKTVVKASKKHAKTYVAGQTGAHNARLKISKSNKRGQTKRGFSVRKGSSSTGSKKKKKLAKF